MAPSTPHTQSPQPVCFTPYGHSGAIGDAAIATGFNGVPFDIYANCYHLGQGYRAFFPGLMRFSSADSLSPFGVGGLNAYAYCKGDPVNYGDPQGTAGVPIGRTGNTPRSAVTARGQFGIGQSSREVKSRRNELRLERMIKQAQERHEQAQAQGVDLALDLLEHKEDLFKRVNQHLGVGVLHRAADLNFRVQERFSTAATRAYTNHMKDILKGQARHYADDGILDIAQRTYLSGLDRRLINAYAPFTENLSGKYSGGYEWDHGLFMAQWKIREAEKFLSGRHSHFSV